MTLARFVFERGVSDASNPAISRGDTVTATYGDLAMRCGSLAASLREKHGLATGDAIAIVARNHPAYLEVLFGAWWAGLVVVPINAKLHPNEISWVVEHSRARAVFTESTMEPAIRASELSRVKLVVSLDSPDYLRLLNSEPAPVIERMPWDLAWLFYTSGTTGRPKGAMLTHRNLLMMALARLADVDPTSPGDPFLHCAPLSHGSGLLSLPHVCRGGLNVIPESGGFEAEEAISLANHWRRTSTFVAPTMVSRLVDAAAEVHPDALRTLVWGGAPMHAADSVRALERFGPCLAQIYGQGESPMTITALSKGQIGDQNAPGWYEHLGSAGTARSPVTLRVADQEGCALSPGEVGEILVRGDTVMAGYWENEEASASALRNGWLQTGDVGMLDREGFLTLLDRSKDLIISGGTNVYPREVEEVLVSHPKVREVSVIGRPDREWGEVVIAYVAGTASAEALDRHCLKKIARFKRPKEYVFVAELPRNHYGKVLKNELRKLDGDRADQAVSR